MSFFNELKRRNVIRVAAGYIVLAWLVVQVVETIFPAFGFGDEAIRAVVIGFAVGFIPVVVLAWVFEWTPEGIKKDEDVEIKGPDFAKAAKRWDRVVMVILALAVAFFVVREIIGPPEKLEHMIAVLPFEGVGLDEGQEYLPVSVAEGVHGTLARVPELLVSFWPAVTALKADGLDNEAIVDTLEVPNYLEGTVTAVGDGVRIEARLIEVESGWTVWSETYTAQPEDIFLIQDQIAAAAVTRLQVETSAPLWRSQPTNPQTFQLTIQGWSLIHRADAAGTGELAEELFLQALELDPRYLSALNGLAFAGYRKYLDGIISREESDALTRDVQERVLAIDTENSIANLYQAWGSLFTDREFAHSNLHLQIAMRTGLNDDETLRVLAGFARRTGNVDAAIWFGQRILTLNPACGNCQWQNTENLFYAREFEDAIEAKKRYQRTGTGGYYNHAIMLLMTGDPEGALDVINTGDTGNQHASISAMAYHALGDNEQFANYVAKLLQFGDAHSMSMLAEVYAFAGDTDKAFAALDEVIAMENHRLHWNIFLPNWDYLRGDPRWNELREKLNWTEEQLSAIDFSKIQVESE